MMKGYETKDSYLQQKKHNMLQIKLLSDMVAIFVQTQLLHKVPCVRRLSRRLTAVILFGSL